MGKDFYFLPEVGCIYTLLSIKTKDSILTPFR